MSQSGADPKNKTNLCYAQFTALLLVEFLEQPIRMLKNERSVILL